MAKPKFKGFVIVLDMVKFLLGPEVVLYINLNLSGSHFFHPDPASLFLP
jgi:hypothetical protein